MIVHVHFPCDTQEFCLEIKNAYRDGTFRGVVLLEREAIFFGDIGVLRTDWSDPWLHGLIRLVAATENSFCAEEVAARVFLRRIFAKGLEGLLNLEEALKRMEEYAIKAKQELQRSGDYAEATEWQALLSQLQDIGPRIHNLQMALGRLAVYLGNRWLLGQKSSDGGGGEDL